MIPIFWGALAFIFFNARESTATKLFWGVVHFTCPFWDLELPGYINFVALPFLNAALYSFVMLLWLQIKPDSGIAKS